MLAIGITRISGAATGSSQGSGGLQCNASMAVTWLSLIQPSSAPSWGMVMPPAISWRIAPGTGSPGWIDGFTPSRRFQERMMKQVIAGLGQDQERKLVLAAWWSRTIELQLLSVQFSVIASGEPSYNCRQASTMWCWMA